MVTRELKLHPYQHLITEHVLSHQRCAVFVFLGAGKSIAVLTAIDALLVSGAIAKPLIIAPLRVARTVWPQEAAKWSHTKHLRVVPIVGDLRARRSALTSAGDLYTTNTEQVPWLVEELGDDWDFDMVVLDELTRWKGFRIKQGAARAAALAKVAHTKVRRLVGLTGTPAPNGLEDLYGQMFFIDGGTRLGRTHSGFVNRWFRSLPTGGNTAWRRIEPMPHAQGEIQEALKDVCLTLDAKDWFDLEAPIVRDVCVDLPPKAAVHYREMERAMFTELDGVGIEAFSAASKTIKTLQICSGSAYSNPEGTEWIEIHDEKLQALESIVEEAGGMPVLVAYHFKSDLARLRERFPQGRVLDANPSTIDQWNAGGIPLLFAHPASAGHGLSLQDGGNILVFFSLWWNLEEHQQIIERIGPMRQRQAGYDRPVFVYRIVARDTIDEDVLVRLETKQDVQDVLLAAMKRRTDV